MGLGGLKGVHAWRGERDGGGAAGRVRWRGGGWGGGVHAALGEPHESANACKIFFSASFGAIECVLLTIHLRGQHTAVECARDQEGE